MNPSPSPRLDHTIYKAGLPDAALTEERDDGWLLGFVDILTLLLTLFVVLLAFTQLPRQPAPHPAVHAAAAAAPPVPAATGTPAAAFAIPADIRDQVEVTTDASDVNLVIKDDVLFDAGSADLKAAGQAVLSRIAELLRQNEYPVSVEGHSDNTPIHTPRFPSNWELSAARATNVTRSLIGLGVAADRLRAIGFAATRPLDDNDSAAGRANNRRVSLVIHMDKTDRAQ
jgi:chemotaxis protein MotB